MYKLAKLLPGHIDPLIVPFAGQPESQGLLSIHSAHCVYGTKQEVTSRTSEPLSRLIKDSFKPLFADEILSITVPIRVRCSSEIEACQRRPVHMSGHISDGPELLLVSLGAEHPGPQAPGESSSGLVLLRGSGEILWDDTSGSSALWGGEV